MQIERADERGSKLRIKSGTKHKNLWKKIHGGVIIFWMSRK